MSQPVKNEPVKTEEFPIYRSLKVGRITLMSQHPFNALNEVMMKKLYRTFRDWRDREDIVCVFLDSNSQKAFCAGGDVKALVSQSSKKRSLEPEGFESFFDWEYRTDHMIHRYPKPVITWGDSVVMGGGMGLFVGASHRIVTERSVLAMPEVTIGFFPDVGASFFLGRLPHSLGLFLGWTGARLSFSDGMYLGFADFLISSDQKENFFDVLCESLKMDLSSNGLDPSSSIDGAAQGFQKIALKENEQPKSRFAQHSKSISEAIHEKNFLDAHKRLEVISSEDDWMNSCLHTFKAGSPSSKRIFYDQLQRAKEMSLEKVFQMEYRIARHFTDPDHKELAHDFKEGVRALLIDKDKNPTWQPASVDDLDMRKIELYFQKIAGDEAFMNDLKAQAGQNQ
jgi:enoyl-CoA hydratase/carnithine racemase